MCNEHITENFFFEHLRVQLKTSVSTHVHMYSMCVPSGIQEVRGHVHEGLRGDFPVLPQLVEIELESKLVCSAQRTKQ